MRNVFRSSRASLAAAAISAALLGGCATTGNPNDPLEGYNRAMFSFNDQVDKVAIKPAAQVYEAVLPSLVRTGIGNVLPLTYFLRLVRGIFLKGSGWMDLWPSIWPLMVFTLVVMAIAVKFYRKTLD